MPYTHGHHDSVLRSHSWRTAENSSAYVLAHLLPGMSLLDVGCGPGTITADLALLAAPGQVVGVDAAPDVVAQARANAATLGCSNLQFEVGDLTALDYPDASFDVVHAHQVLQHLADPTAALVGLRRVLRSTGFLAARDADHGAFTWAPADPALERWRSVYLAVTRRNGHDARIGPRLPALARAAGFSDVTVSSSTWTFADPASRAWWGGLWAERVRSSGLAEQAIAYEVCNAAGIEEIAEAFTRWAAAEDGVFVVPHVEIIARG